MATSELLFKAMADPTRQRLLTALTLCDLTVGELVEVLDQPQSTVSRHLRLLKEAGLVLDHRSGKSVTYAMQPVSASAGMGSGNGGALANGSMELRNRLLQWAAAEPLDPAMRGRIEQVRERRSATQAGFFDALGTRWDQLREEAFGHAFHLEGLTALLPREWTVGDIGTGTGYMLGTLAGSFGQVIAVDPSERMLDIARSRAQALGAGNVSFREGALEALPIEDGELDLALASLVLHHVPEPPAALHELQRCLRPGGRLLVIEQDEHHAGAFRERMGDLWWGIAPAKLAAWMTEAGFDDVRTQPVRSVRSTMRQTMEIPPLYVAIARVGAGETQT